MKNPKILCVCTAGLNRSKYLASYLKKKGYETRYGGAGVSKSRIKSWLNRRKFGFTDNPLIKEDVKWADIIIVVRPKHEHILKKKFKINDKKIIVLDVSDSQKRAIEKDKKYAKMDSKQFQKIWTYPKLRQAIKPYLSLRK